MRWLSYLVPQTVAIVSSPYNALIRINLESGQYKLLVNGARESGQYIRELWKHAFSTLGMPISRPMKKILVLGVAGGTVIHMLHDMYPEANITGVDIDQVMIDVGKKYFGLGDIKNLHCVRDDAKVFIRSYKGKPFDLIVIDIFIGPDVPDFVTSLSFESTVKKILSKQGRTIINYLQQPGYEEKAPKLKKILRTLYKTVRHVNRFNNRFFLAE